MASPPRVALAMSVTAATADAEPAGLIGHDASESEGPLRSAPVTQVTLLVATSIAVALGLWLLVL